MKQFLSGEACSWTDIKRRLDPVWSYLVIETTAASGAEVFDSVVALLSEHADGIQSQEICRETASGKMLLLLQIDPRQTEAVKNTLLDPRLPPSVTVYFYNHAPLRSEQGRRPDDAQ
jgi:hypothetical protein